MIKNRFLTFFKKNFQFVLIAIFIVLTALIVGGGVYLWAHQKQIGFKNEIVSLQKKVDQLEKTNNSTSIWTTTDNNQSDDLFETKFRLAIMYFWGVRNVFRDPKNKNKFYYITNSNIGTDSTIWVYDLLKDKTYKQNGTFNILEGNTRLLSQKFTDYKKFVGAGIVDNKFVFAETWFDDSPGPCFSSWFYPQLEYIDLGVSNPPRKAFTLPKDLKRMEEKKLVECKEKFEQLFKLDE